MNFLFKKIVMRINVLRFLRKTTAYVLIFSLLWQNCLWAEYGLSILEENLEGTHTRTYNGRRIGLVEPGTIRDNEIHNVFEDLQLLEEGGIVFKGAPDTTKIYNRIYSEDPVQLSGVIETDYSLPMVFANPGGIVLENPDFQNIHDLTLAAGALAQTNKGMAYGVDQGFISLNKTFIQEENDLNNLSLAGRGIRIHQSFLSPSETLILRTGQHVKGWNKDGEWISEDYLEQNYSPLLEHNSIILDDATILRSKSLFLESLENGAAIHANGLLQSTEGDIIIRSRGDVYVDKFCAHRNLKIKTTGKVFLRNHTFVGGSVKIKAAEITNQGELIGRGKITFDAPWSQNEGFIKTEGLFDAKNIVNAAYGRIEAKSVVEPLALLSRNLGNIEVQDDLKFIATTETLKGTIKTHGKIEVSGQGLILDGTISAQNGFFCNDLKKLTNKEKSTFSAFGGGLQGKLTVFENEGKIDLSSANAWIGRSTNKKSGLIRTRGHSILQGDHHFNYGTIFTCGIHHTALTGTYKDTGTFYSPTVLLLDAQEINYTDVHKSFLKDGVISARSLLNVGNKVCFELKGNLKSCFLQLNSKQSLRFNGEIRQFSLSSESFPIVDYFKVFNQLPVSPDNFKNEIALLSLKSWEKTRPHFGSAITLQAGGDMNYEGARISQESGSVNFFAKNKVCAKNSNIKAGYFNGDSTSIKCNTAVLNDTKLTSLFGNTSLIAQEMSTLNNCHIQGGLSTQVNSQNLWMDRCEVSSTYGLVGIHGTQVTNINNSSIQANSIVSITGGESAIINQSTLRGQSTVVDGGKRLTLSQSHVEGLYNSFRAKHINAVSNTIYGSTFFCANNNLHIHDLNSSGAVKIFAPTSTFSGTTKADFLQVQSKVIKQLGTTKTAKDTHMEAEKAYIDTPESLNEAGENLFIYAEETTGFKGYQKAGEKLEVVLKDMNLLDLLSQTDARLTKAHLIEGKVSFKEDFILDRTLHLWAKSLENKAKFTATKDFLAHIQTEIMNHGSMIVQGNLGIESQGILANFGLMEAANLNVKGKTVVNESLVDRKTILGGYRDELNSEAILRARTGNLKVEATDLLQARGAKFEAKLNVDIKSAGKLYLGAQQLYSEATHSDNRSYYHRYTRCNHKTQVNAGANVNILSGEGMIFEGLDVTATGYIHAISKGTLENKTVHNIVQEERRTESKGGFFNGNKTESTQTIADTVVRNTFKSGEDVRFESEGDNLQQAPHIESGGLTTIISNQGKVSIKADKSSYMTSTQKSSKSAVWQSQQQKGRYDETIVMLEILARGGIHISGAKGVEVEIRQNQNIDHSLDLLEKYAETSWVKELRKDPKVTWHLIAEEHKQWNQKVQGLTGPAAAVIALAVAIATQGVGASLISGLTTNATIGAMSSAGFTSLVSQASISLVNNQGDLSKVLKDMGSKENLRLLATSVASAGIVQGLSAHLNLPEHAKGFAQHLQKSVVNSGTSAGLSMLIHTQDVKEALLQAAKGIAAGTIGGLMANNIGSAYGHEDLNWVMHKLAHGALGAFTGAILGDDLTAGALAGALGGITSEIITDSMMEGAIERALGKALDQAANEERPLTYNELQVVLSDEVKKVANMARMGSAFSAFALNQDVNIATTTATNAVDNNFIPLVMVGLSITSALYSGYEVYSAYESDGVEGALHELAKQGVINLAGGAIGKLGTKAAAATLKAVLDKNPMLAMVFHKASNKFSKAIHANIKWGKSIQEQGMPWEKYLESQLSPGSKLPKNFKTFDFFDRSTGVATSAKTLNTQTTSKLADPTKIYSSLKKNIDSAASFKKYTLLETEITSADIISRELRVAIPKGTTSNQWDYIWRAIEYGKTKGVTVHITTTK